MNKEIPPGLAVLATSALSFFFGTTNGIHTAHVETITKQLQEHKHNATPTR